MTFHIFLCFSSFLDFSDFLLWYNERLNSGWGCVGCFFVSPRDGEASRFGL